MSSQDLATFLTQVRSMFNQVEEEAEAVVQTWFAKINSELVLRTYGPGNQWEGEGAAYIATGRLRMGWRWGVTAPSSVPLTGFTGAEDPSQRGDIAVATLDAEVQTLGVRHPEMFLYEEVGYAFLITYGLEGHAHIGARPWITDFVDEGRPQALLDEAMAEVSAGA